MYFAEVANDETLDPEIRLDASKAAAPYIHPRLKPIEINPEALVDLERDIAAARLEGAGKALNNNPGLADRLLRAQMRADDAVVVYSPVVVEAVKTPVGRAVADPEPEPAVEVADDENSALGPSRADPEPDPIYIPVMPLPKATAFSGGWPAEPPQVDYDPLDDER